MVPAAHGVGTGSDRGDGPCPPPSSQQLPVPSTGTTESRIMTELFVLAGGGTQPFWNTSASATAITATNRNTSRTNHPVANVSDDCSSNSNNCNTTTTIPISRSQYVAKIVRIVAYLWMISIAIKVLLFPAYKSTDFDVHRHWKALTYYHPQQQQQPHSHVPYIPMVHWYANNTWIPITPTGSDISTTSHRPTTPTKSVETVHTLDYPPGFALMEYMMVNHWIVHRWLFRDCHRRRSTTTGNSDSHQHPHPDRCFDIMDDSTIYHSNADRANNQQKKNSQMKKSTGRHDEVVITTKCRSYMRSTVIVFADTMYWLGAFVVSLSLFRYRTTPSSHPNEVVHKLPPTTTNDTILPVSTSSSSLALFVFFTFHPTLLWLDHVHFQYNGTMLGLLLLSIGLLLLGNNNGKHDGNTTARKKRIQLYCEHVYHILAVVVFGLLLTFKHLYITNSVWYIIYVIRRYCLTSHRSDGHPHPPPRRRLRVQWLRLCSVAICGSIAIAGPFLPFLIAIYYSDTKALSNATTNASYLQRVQEWLIQLVHRLFPFQRGLVHTYWAGNVWAIYMASHKITVYLGRVVGIIVPFMPSPDTITPKASAVAMLLAQIPGLCMAWLAAVHECNIRLLQSFTIVSLGTFLFQYHAHEKAIVTSLLPCIVWFAMIRYRNEATEKRSLAGSIAFDMNAYSILGLYPLLYQSQELLLKVSSTILYLSLLWFWCTTGDSSNHRNDANSQSVGKVATPTTNWYTILIVTVTILQLEIPYTWFWGKYEFMPLAVTSLVCAFGYISLFVRLICY